MEGDQYREVGGVVNSDCTSEMGCWPGQPRRAEAKKSPGGTRLRRGMHAGRGGFRASACAGYSSTPALHQPDATEPPAQQIDQRARQATPYKPLHKPHLAHHRSPATAQSCRRQRRAAGSTGRCRFRCFLLIDFRSDARNPPRIAQQFVNVAAARLAADPEQSGRNSVKHLSANGLMRGDGQGNVGVGQG
jgi:hypothetical protein